MQTDYVILKYDTQCACNLRLAYIFMWTILSSLSSSTECR